MVPILLFLCRGCAEGQALGAGLFAFDTRIRSNEIIPVIVSSSAEYLLQGCCRFFAALLNKIQCERDCVSTSYRHLEQARSKSQDQWCANNIVRIIAAF